MRKQRLKIKGQRALYHVMSRTVNGEIFFSEEEKEAMRRMLFKVAGFCGVKILTYCLMGNHFHVLVEVPDGQGIKLDDAELLRRYSLLHGEDGVLRKSARARKYAPNTPNQVERTLKDGGEEAEKMRASLRSRMHDLSAFVKIYKQQVSIWYNANHDRYGPLWSDRFKSVLVQGSGSALLVMAAYIYLNPVRAGLVEDPRDYAFSGYGEGEKEGKPQAKLVDILRGLRGDEWGLEVLLEYRLLLLGQAGGTGAKEEISEILSARAMASDAKQGKDRQILKAFSRGIVMGTQVFVENCYQILGIHQKAFEFPDEMPGVSVGQKQFRERGSFKP
ncbi:MAG: transposase [Opitutales bacterium]|nr:transposase [Opitutales bacterium]